MKSHPPIAYRLLLRSVEGGALTRRRCGALLAILLLLCTARADTVVVPPNPNGGTQAKAPNPVLGVGTYGSKQTGWNVEILTVGTSSRLLFHEQFAIAATIEDLFVITSGIIEFGLQIGSGYSQFSLPDVRVISSEARQTPRMAAIPSDRPGFFTGIEDLYLFNTGALLTDDATIVIDPPHLHDLQGALTNASVDVIQLQTGLYFENAIINRNLTIRGEGMGRTIISGGLLGSVFKILPGVTVYLEDMTIIDGLAPSGGGIFNDGTLYVLRCEITECRAYQYLSGEGGGIFNRGRATLNIRDSYIHHNRAERDGGGISSSGFNMSSLPAAGGGSASNYLAASYSDLNVGEDTNNVYGGLLPTIPASTNEMEVINDRYQSNTLRRLPGSSSPSTKDHFTALFNDPYSNISGWSAMGSPVCIVSNTVISDNKVGIGAANARIAIAFAETRLPRAAVFGGGIHTDLGLLKVQDSTVQQNEAASDFGSFGGGISALLSSVQIVNSKLNGNHVSTSTIFGMGGAVYSFAALTRIDASTMNSNTVNGLSFTSGGAVKNTAGSYTEINRCEMNNNLSSDGGGIANDLLAHLEVNDCMIRSNSVSGITSANGGGVRNESGGVVSITRSTISGNSARGAAKGGGVYNECTGVWIDTIPIIEESSMTLQNCTISENVVDGTGPFGIPLVAYGAGVFNGSSDVGEGNTYIYSCTIFGNRATNGFSHRGGGLYSTARSDTSFSTALDHYGPATVELANTLIAHNEPDDCYNDFISVLTRIVSRGYNMDTDGSAESASRFYDQELSSSAQFRTVTNAFLSPLINNGGPTLTHALLAGSPAIDRGAPTGILSPNLSPSMDQRGLPRAVGTQRDIGAFESLGIVANNERYETLEDVLLVVNAQKGVLSNDFANGLRASLVAPPASGTLNFFPDGSFSYMPATNFIGTNIFTYRVLEPGTTNFVVATATIAVRPRLDWLAMIPTPGTQAERYADIVLSFDEPVTVAAVQANVTLTGSQSGPHGFTVTANGAIATLNPLVNFEVAEQVSVTVGEGMTSAAGSPIFPAAMETYSILSNRPPVGVADSFTMTEDQTLHISPALLMTNDFDPDLQTVMFVSNLVVMEGTLLELVVQYGQFMSISNQPFYLGEYPLGSNALVVPIFAQHGTLTLGTNGIFTYRPNTNFTGVDTFSYRITDGLVDPVTVAVTINITNANDAPLGAADLYPLGTRTVTAANGVLVNDGDVDSPSTSLRSLLATQAVFGVVALNTNGSFIYTPSNNYDGAEVFTYRVSDGSATSAPVRVKIGNSAPVAAKDLYTPTLGAVFSITNVAQGLLANDSDTDGDSPLTAQFDSAPAHGVVVLNENGTFTYTPDAGYTNTDSFQYRANDGIESSALARVKIGNTAPIATGESNYVTFSGRTLTVNAAQGVLPNDSDADGDTLTAQLAATTPNGSLSFSPNGSFSYNPNPGFTGNDSFTYRANDGITNSAAATAVVAVFDYLRPTQFSPARNSSLAATNAPIQITFNAPLSAASLSNRIAVFGSLSGRRTFSTSVSGNQLTIQPTGAFRPGEEVSVSLLAGIRGTGLFQLDKNFTWQFTTRAVRGSAFFAQTAPGTNALAAYSVALGDLNGDGRIDAVVLQSTNPPLLYLNQGNRVFTNRTESLGGNWSFTLSSQPVVADFNGDGVLDIAVSVGTTSIRVGLNNGAATFTPVVVATGASVSKLLAADFDGDGDLDLFAVGSTGCQVFLNDGAGQFTAGPVRNFSGYDMTVGDVDGDGDLDVYITGIIGDKLLLNAGTGAFTLSDTPLDNHLNYGVRLLDVDGDGDVDLVIGPSTYRAGTVWLNDGTGRFARSAFEISGSLSYSFAMGDLDGDGDFDSFYRGAGTTVSLNNGTGRFTATSQALGNSNLFGIAIADLDNDGDLDVFTVGGSTSSRSVPEVFYNQSVPRPRDDFYAANGSNPVTVNAASGVLSNDFAGDGAMLISLLATNPARGTVTLNTNGSFTYTPGGSFAGTDVFMYRASDGVSTSAVARVKIGNTAPLAVSDTNYVVVNDSQLRVDAPGVLANDSDAEGDPLAAQLVAAPTHGTVLLRADGSFLYTAISNYTGADSFTYRASDGFATSAVASVTLDTRARLAIVASAPSANALRAKAAANIVLGFNRALNAATLATNVFLSGSFTGPRVVAASRESAANYTGEGATVFRAAGAVEVLIIDPSIDFLPGEIITVTLTSGLQGAGGERLVTPQQLTFSAEAPFGVGRFTDSTQRLGSNTTRVILLGDFDRDGDLDAMTGKTIQFSNAVPIPGSGALMLWRNNGSGQFTDSGQRLGDSSTASLSSADVDDDGDLDVLADEQLWLNNGAGVFSAGAVLGTNVSGSLFADVNSDSKPDVITWTVDAVTVWLNNGVGVFTQNPASVAGLNFVNLRLSRLAVGDLDGDGSPDLFALRVFGSDPDRVWLNDGRGIFRESGQLFGGGSSAPFSLADVDDDGDLDAFTPAPGASSLWLNRGDGTFVSAGFLYASNVVTDVRFTDANGDGALDLFVAQYQSSTFSNTSTVLLNDGYGNFTASGVSLGASTMNPTNASQGSIINRALAVGDLNGDGAPDALIAGDRFGLPGPIQVWFNRAVLGPIDGGTTLVINDTQTTTPFTNIVVRGPVNVALTITLDDIARGAFTPASLAASGFTGPIGSAFSRPASSATSAQAAIRQLVFAPTPNRVLVGSNEVTAFTIVGNDTFVSRTNEAATVTSISVNDAPMAVNDSGAGFTTVGNVSFVTASVLANDSDADPSDPLTIVNVNTTGTSGSVSNLGGGAFRYTPNAALASLPGGASATDTFNYTIRDASGVSAIATVRITVNGTNDVPIAVNDVISLRKNASLTVLTATLLANDSDPDAGGQARLTISAVNTNGTRGRVHLDPTAGVAYNPSGAFSNLADGVVAIDTFTYTLRDTNVATSTATVTLRILGVDEPPVARPDALTIQERAARTNLNAILLANDSDPDGGQTPLISIIGIDTAGTTGQVTFSNGVVAYDPAGRFRSLAAAQSTNDTFRYSIATPTVATVAQTSTPISLLLRETFVNVRVEVSLQGLLNLTFDGQTIYTNVVLPGFTPLTGARFALGGRTGGAFETHDIDDLALSLLGATPTNVNYNFGSNTPAGSTLLGSAVVTNGYLRLTPAQTQQTGTFIVPDLAPSNSVAGFVASFKVRMGSPSVPPADGFSFVWGTSLPGIAFGEEGAGYGLVVSFDTYDNGNSEAPAISVKWRTPIAQGVATVTVTGQNDAPLAVEDHILLNEGSGASHLTAVLLANDSDPDNGETATLTITSVSGVTTNGVVTLQSGAVRYLPYANANLRFGDFAMDSFAYTLRDVNGATSNALAVVYVAGTNETFLPATAMRISPGSNASQVVEFPATPGALVALETSTNLVNWSFYASVFAPTNGLAQFIERNTTNPPIRFYRVKESGAMPPGLVSYWRADGDTTDSFGTNHAQLTNGLSYTSGQFGSAFHFTGGSERLAFGGGSIPRPWTASFWVNRQDAFDASAALLTDSAYALKIEQFAANRRVGITQYTVNDWAYNYTVPTNTWTHLIFVCTTNGTELFANGVSVGSLSLSFPLPLGTISRPGAGDRLRAAVDEISVFNRALTPPEVLNLHNATRKP